ncbi:carcinoembryonic antigen-related cell adhesion molecule 3-like [Chionomys nivalis]|uniref:carcinoembryonic antigen-related cell adhesion molecule 3-like n=1 Tax=Chionomys nivalis TaxID=269649 RepID=UPI0025936D26|nr:carcinoembryonic antigen-related cell adhesion molecule 3-like [Chionomys nivalis]
MEVSSVLLCNGCTSWQGLLFTASLLTCWQLPTAIQVRNESVPPQVVEGENVLLLVNGLPKSSKALLPDSHSQFCNPFASSQLMIQPVPRYATEGEEYRRAMNSIIWGPEVRRRDIVYNNGSLMLQDLTEKDAGIYTLAVLNKDSKIEKAYVEFYVKSK